MFLMWRLMWISPVSCNIWKGTPFVGALGQDVDSPQWLLSSAPQAHHLGCEATFTQPFLISQSLSDGN